MKKLISIALMLAATYAANAQWGNYAHRRYSFLNPDVFGDPQASGQPYQNTNASLFKGITITNGASAPLGGYTNINSWTYGPVVMTTNGQYCTWTNALNIWVIPTNNTPGTVSGIRFVTNDSTPLTVDVPLWCDHEGRLPFTVLTNTANNDSIIDKCLLPNMNLHARISGDTSAGGTLNLIFIGLPDGRNEASSATVGPIFQWGIAGASGVTDISTNFPIWKFAGCSKVRLRSATITTSTAAAIDVTIQDLSLNGFAP